MIIGIGTDIIEINRFIGIANKKNQMERIFTKNEQLLFNGRNYSTLAANFAAKEAFAKAVGTGFRSFMPIDIEVMRNELGKPYINLYNNAKSIADSLNVGKIHISLSHSKENAIAYLILEE
ncbi:MAG: holo-ACP synthase [Firmicutes bacterium]|nr:holo-ACP synthase [Bacillota bacterium]